jgi:hypothetical protein
MTKLIVAFQNFANAPKHQSRALLRAIILVRYENNAGRVTAACSDVHSCGLVHTVSTGAQTVN